MKTKEEILFELPNFYGTASYHRWSPLFRNVVLTDGALYIAEACGAYWLMDAIASHRASYQQESFVVATLGHFAETTKWSLALDDGNGNPLATQIIEYSDFPLDEIKLYIVKQENLWVILLPSEY